MSALIKLASWALLIGAITASILLAVNYLYQKGYVSGYDSSEAAWQKKHAEEMELKAFNYNTLKEILRNRETEFGEKIDSLAKTHNEELTNAERGREMAINAAISSTFKLYDLAGEWDGTELRIGGERSDREDELSAPSCGINDRREGELSPEFTAFLLAESSRSDRITDKLSKLQTYTKELFNSCSSRELIE